MKLSKKIEFMVTTTILLAALVILAILFSSCAKYKIDHVTGEKTPTRNTIHLDKVHKGRVWYAGKYLIIPDSLKLKK